MYTLLFQAKPNWPNIVQYKHQPLATSKQCRAVFLTKLELQLDTLFEFDKKQNNFV